MSPRRTAVTRLRLDSFRNYASLSLSPGPGPVVLCGDNGAGKTNLLEAVSFLSPGRGLRRADYADVARLPGRGTWAVAVEADGASGPVEIGTGLQLGPDGAPERQRRIRINHAPVRSAEALLEHLRVVWLTPAMDGLFTGPAGDRRRFLDRLVLAIDPGHGTRVSAFERALTSRNRLLEDASPDARWLDGLEAQIAELGTAIAAARVELVARLAALVGDVAEAGSPFPFSRLSLEGTIESGFATGAAVDVEDGYREALGRMRRRDAAAGRTLEGPHRSDLVVVHGPKEMPAGRCSTGEQKALLVGLVIAHARVVAASSGIAPIMLLDEIAAHLDDQRRAALFDILVDLGVQAFMTGTDRALFSALAGKGQIFRVSGGTLSGDAA
ncbi:MAG: DNA replication/repair protein RecF [Hyphomicrobiales bacterium]